MASWSKRGKGSCSQCGWEYNCRYKPPQCPECSNELGGSYVSRKKKRPLVPKCTLVAQSGLVSIYSANTSTHDDRCIVVKQANILMCHHHICKQNRAIHVNSQKVADFNCQHLQTIPDCVSPVNTFDKLPDADNYPCDESTKASLREAGVACAANGFPIAVHVSPTMYCVFGRATTNSTAGYCHVRVTDTEIRCCSKDCKSSMVRAKQQKSRRICTHIHVLLSLGISKELENNSSEQLLDDSSNMLKDDEKNDNCTESRRATIELKMKRTLPLHIPLAIINKAGEIDADQSGWQGIFEPEQENCELCNGKLGLSKIHPGQRGRSVLITNMHPFKTIKMHVKHCCNCSAMHQVFPYELGLFNICDKVLVSLEILLEWRQLFRRGVPISIAINSKLDAMVERVEESPTKNELQNIATHLYNGFYCFEAITERNLDDGICGICGVIGEVYFGDGNEKNCCDISEIEYAPQNNGMPSETGPISLEEFLNTLKKRWVECTTYTRSEKFNIHFSHIPPVMAPAMKGPCVLNTEAKKKSTFLKQHGKPNEGDPALLHHEIVKQKIDMSNIQELDIESLKCLCQSCGISTSNKSLVKMQIDLQSLYETLLIGSSPCHGFTQVPGHTGGFYHVVCRHGITAASKFLTLQESVRDPVDLYLSFKHTPLVFLCDTACGFVRHLECRDKDASQQLWGKYRGCFEEPSLDKLPDAGMSVPLLTTAEYREKDTSTTMSEDTSTHPLTGTSRRYVLGDRFHTSSNPHKSPLCQYHDINLLAQSNTIKTSYQESENNRKNVRRLRSSCMQNFSTHFFYNYLMDFYQNSEIVREQYAVACKELKPGQEIRRNAFMQFTIQDS